MKMFEFFFGGGDLKENGTPNFCGVGAYFDPYPFEFLEHDWRGEGG